MKPTRQYKMKTYHRVIVIECNLRFISVKIETQNFIN